jgi:hypothetical protein
MHGEIGESLFQQNCRAVSKSASLVECPDRTLRCPATFLFRLRRTSSLCFACGTAEQALQRVLKLDHSRTSASLILRAGPGRLTSFSACSTRIRAGAWPAEARRGADQPFRFTESVAWPAVRIRAPDPPPSRRPMAQGPVPVRARTRELRHLDALFVPPRRAPFASGRCRPGSPRGAASPRPDLVPPGPALTYPAGAGCQVVQ